MTKPTIIANGIVLTCDAANRCGRYNLLVHNGRILSISNNLELLMREHPDAQLLDARDKVITPGFVNAHYHGESFLLHALTNGLHFELWKEDEHLKQATHRLLHSSGDDIRRIYRAAYLAHLKSGTTCVCEFPSQLDEDGFTQMLEAIGYAGLTAVVTLRNWDQIRKTRELRDKPRVAVSLGEEEAFTVYSIEKLSQAAKELKAPLLAHIAEHRADVEIVRKNFQKNIISLLSSFNAVRQETILVHANHVDEDEVLKVKELGCTAVVCTRSTAAKQTGYPGLRHLAKRHVRLALGTDWGGVDMIGEMRFIGQLPLVVSGLRVFSSLEVLRMATINGATALGLSNELGSLEVGKRADLVIFNKADVRIPFVPAFPAAEIVSDLVVNHFTTGNIESVMIAGELKVANGNCVSISEREVIEEFESTYSKTIPDQFIGRTPESSHGEETLNVLPFIPDVRTPQDASEGFEAGFPATTKQATIVEIADTPVNPLVNRPKPQRDPIKPELPKNTRRVFGEDDDV